MDTCSLGTFLNLPWKIRHRLSMWLIFWQKYPCFQPLTTIYITNSVLQLNQLKSQPIFKISSIKFCHRLLSPPLPMSSQSNSSSRPNLSQIKKWTCNMMLTLTLHIQLPFFSWIPMLVSVVWFMREHLAILGSNIHCDLDCYVGL